MTRESSSSIVPGVKITIPFFAKETKKEGKKKTTPKNK